MLMAARMSAGAKRRAAAVAQASIVKTQSQTNNQNNSQYILSSISFGSPSQDRFLIICVGYRNISSNTTIQAVKAGTVDALQLVNKISENSNDANCAIWLTETPNVDETIADVSVTLSATVLNIGITVYAITGFPNFPDLMDSTTAVSSAASMSMDLEAGGVAVGCVCASGSAPNFTWSFLTEDTDQLNESGTTTGMASRNITVTEVQDCKCTGADASQFAACAVSLRQPVT